MHMCLNFMQKALLNHHHLRWWMHNNTRKAYQTADSQISLQKNVAVFCLENALWPKNLSFFFPLVSFFSFSLRSTPYGCLTPLAFSRMRVENGRRFLIWLVRTADLPRYYGFTCPHSKAVWSFRSAIEQWGHPYVGRGRGICVTNQPEADLLKKWNTH